MEQEKKSPAHPGFELKRCIEKTIHTKAEIAQMLSMSRQQMHAILSGVKPISPTVAAKLGKMFNTGGFYWLSKQANFDAAHAESVNNLEKIPVLFPKEPDIDQGLKLVKTDLWLKGIIETPENMIQAAVQKQDDATIIEAVEYYDNFDEFVIDRGRDNVFFDQAIRILGLPMTINTIKKIVHECMREAIRRGLKMV